MKLYHIAVILALINVTLEGIMAQDAPKAFTNCSLEHRTEDVRDMDGKLVKILDLGWYASCKITFKEKVIWNRVLPMAHPATFREAMDAVERFLKDKSKEIVKEHLETGKPCDQCEIKQPKPVSDIRHWNCIHWELG